MKKLLASILGFAMLATPLMANAAIAIGNGPTFSGSDAWSFSVTAGTNVVLFVFVDALNNDTTACTYGGDSMTLVRAAITNGSDHFTMWYKVNPKTGSNTVDCTTSGESYRGEEAIAYTGVDQSTPVDASAANASSASVSVTTTVTGDFFGGGAFSNGGSVTTPYTTFTNIDIGYLYTTSGQGSAGATTLAFTNSGGTPSLQAVAIKPAASATVGTVNSSSQFILIGDW